MDKDMEEHPIHRSQHGFTKGRSTESVISNTVDYIEQFLFDKTPCLGMFLDISSAFDSISIDHIRDTLLAHNGTPDMVEWYYSYLGRRYLDIELHGENTQLTTATGFPQGGVCSAKFWLIAFDEAIHIINSQKTVAVMFTRATRDFTCQVRMDGQLIPYSPSVIYLGVTLVQELKWKPHILNKIKKVKGLLMKIASITSAYWGPKPKLMKWAYTGIVQPALLYAAMAWAHAIESEDIITLLRRINRQAMNTIVKVPRSTPTQAMELILDIIPLHIHIKKEGLAAYIRLKS